MSNKTTTPKKNTTSVRTAAELYTSVDGSSIVRAYQKVTSTDGDSDIGLVGGWAVDFGGKTTKILSDEEFRKSYTYTGRHSMYKTPVAFIPKVKRYTVQVTKVVDGDPNDWAPTNRVWYDYERYDTLDAASERAQELVDSCQKARVVMTNHKA